MAGQKKGKKRGREIDSSFHLCTVRSKVACPTVLASRDCEMFEACTVGHARTVAIACAKSVNQ